MWVFLFLGVEKLYKLVNVYIKWNLWWCDGFEDKECNIFIGFFGCVMIVYGEDFEVEFEFGNCLLLLG